jgi:MFS superfamily sulfate permease-like transporter
MIVKLEEELQKKGIHLRIVEALVQTRELLRKQNLEKAVGHISRKISVLEVVEEFEKGGVSPNLVK